MDSHDVSMVKLILEELQRNPWPSSNPAFWELIESWAKEFVITNQKGGD